MDIKENLKKARKERGLTQDELAERLGMTRQAYCNMERGKTDLIHRKLYEIAKFYDMSIESLLLGFSSAGDVKELSEKLSSATQEISRLVILVGEMQKAVYLQKEHIRTLKQIQDYIFGRDSEAILKDMYDRSKE